MMAAEQSADSSGRKTQVQPQGLLLVGHGTRDETGRREFLDVVKLVAQRVPDWAVEPCFLELAEPSITEAIARLARRGVRQLTVAPQLLFAAGHAKDDVPRAVAAAAAAQGICRWRQAPHFGPHPKILELSALRYRQALSDRPSLAAGETLLVMVGRGSHDAEATAQMRQFAAFRVKQTPVGKVITTFLAMAQPSLDESLREARTGGWSRVVVQPHLLFHGTLLTALQKRVAAMAPQTGRQDRQEWIVTDPLGADDLLAGAIIDIAGTVQYDSP